MSFERNKPHVAISSPNQAYYGRSFLTTFVRTEIQRKVKGIGMSVMLEAPIISRLTVPTYQELAMRAIAKYHEVRAKPLTEQERGILYYTGHRRE